MENVRKKRPIAEEILNHIFLKSRLQISIFHLSMKLLNALLLKMKLMAVSKLLKIPKPDILVNSLMKKLKVHLMMIRMRFKRGAPPLTSSLGTLIKNV